MKAILNFRKSIFYVVALSVAVSMYSCSDDDDNGKKPLTITDVNGSYEGKMIVTERDTELRDAAEVPSFTVTAKFDSNKAKFEDFPVDNFVIAIEGEEAAKEILEGLEAIPFELEYEPKLNTAQDSIYLTPKAGSLVFSYNVTEEGAEEPVKKDITVSIKADVAVSAYSSKKVKLALIADEIKVGEDALDPYILQLIQVELIKK